LFLELRPEQIVKRLAETNQLCRRIVAEVPYIARSPHRSHLLDLQMYLDDVGGGTGLHAHPAYEIVLFLTGTGITEPGGARTQPGIVLAHSPGIPHGWRPTSQCIRCAIRFAFTPKPLVLPERMPWPNWPEANLEILRMLGDAAAQRQGWQDRAACHLGLVLSSVMSLALEPSEFTVPPSAGSDLVVDVDAFLRAHLAEPVLLRDIARAVGMSVRTLTAQFHRLADETVMTRLLRLRIERVHELLRNTDATLAEIGQQVNMRDPSYLCRCYRRVYGSSPRRSVHATSDAQSAGA